MESTSLGLERFVKAQECVYSDVLAELSAGRKESHWMWFVFPQIRGLGRSPNAEFFGIQDINEARGYLIHPLLGFRLLECTKLVLRHRERSARSMFGFPDNLKLCSSMTLFRQVSPNPDNVFRDVIDNFYAGKSDQQTVRLLIDART